jgi:hypothetical protein
MLQLPTGAIFVLALIGRPATIILVLLAELACYAGKQRRSRRLPEI